MIKYTKTNTLVLNIFLRPIPGTPIFLLYSTTKGFEPIIAIIIFLYCTCLGNQITKKLAVISNSILGVNPKATGS